MGYSGLWIKCNSKSKLQRIEFYGMAFIVSELLQHRQHSVSNGNAKSDFMQIVRGTTRLSSRAYSVYTIEWYLHAIHPTTPSQPTVGFNLKSASFMAKAL